MSLKYIDSNGASHVVSGMTPGGNLETGAVATREGSGTITVAAQGVATVAITFDTPMPDADYEILYNTPGFAYICCNTYAKTVNGFTLAFTNLFSTAQNNVPYTWTAFKLYTVANAEQLYSSVQDIEDMIPSNASSTNKFATADDLRTDVRGLDRRLDDVEDCVPSSASVSNQLVTNADLQNVTIDELGEIQDVDVSGVTDGQTIIWDDANQKWVNGQGGKVYSAGDGIFIDSNDEISAKINRDYLGFDTNDNLIVNEGYKKTFVGTKAEWDALSAGDKKKYTIANITDDVIGGEVADAVTDGLMSPVTSNAVYDYPIDSIADGQHRPPTSNAVYDALALKQGIIKSKTIQNATTEQYYNAVALELTSTQIPVSVRVTNGNIVAFLIACAGTWYLAVYENKTDGYKTPVYNTNIGTLTVYYFEI